ncbi:MAG: hypothetical protein K0R77_2625 [Chryseobacterium sp.]|jgi:hypothetical protein|nr:hypothetical protein [Chryseobacterium sp.]
MSAYILSNRTIIRYKGKKNEPLSSDEYSILNIRIAKYNFGNYAEPKLQAKDYFNRKISDYKLLTIIDLKKSFIDNFKSSTSHILNIDLSYKVFDAFISKFWKSRRLNFENFKYH